VPADPNPSESRRGARGPAHGERPTGGAKNRSSTHFSMTRAEVRPTGGAFTVRPRPSVPPSDAGRHRGVRRHSTPTRPGAKTRSVSMVSPSSRAAVRARPSRGGRRQRSRGRSPREPPASGAQNQSSTHFSTGGGKTRPAGGASAQIHPYNRAPHVGG